MLFTITEHKKELMDNKNIMFGKILLQIIYKHIT